MPWDSAVATLALSFLNPSSSVAPMPFADTTSAWRPTMLDRGVILAAAQVGEALFVSVYNSAGSASDAVSASAVYMSFDGGHTWTPVWEAQQAAAVVTALAGCGTALYAGTVGQGVRRTADRGQTWRSVGAERAPAAPVVALAARDADGFAGLQGGGLLRWTVPGDPEAGAASAPERGPARGVTALLAHGGAVYASHQLGIDRLQAPAAGWQSADVGVPAGAFVQHLAADGAGVLYAATPTTVLRSDDGRRWSMLPSWAWEGQRIHGLARSRVYRKDKGQAFARALQRGQQVLENFRIVHV